MRITLGRLSDGAWKKFRRGGGITLKSAYLTPFPLSPPVDGNQENRRKYVGNEKEYDEICVKYKKYVENMEKYIGNMKEYEEWRNMWKI